MHLRRVLSAACGPAASRRFHVSASSNHHALAIRQPAPAFTGNALMPGGAFKSISLSDYAGRWLVLASYPADFTFVVRASAHEQPA